MCVEGETREDGGRLRFVSPIDFVQTGHIVSGKSTRRTGKRPEAVPSKISKKTEIIIAVGDYSPRGIIQDEQDQEGDLRDPTTHYPVHVTEKRVIAERAALF